MLYSAVLPSAINLENGIAPVSGSFVGSHAGSLAQATDGGRSETYTAPASGQGTDQITYTDPAGDTLSFTVSF